MEVEVLATIRTNGDEETERLGEELGARLPRGAMLALIGELGSGKTTFVRGLARGLGVRQSVTSPTFTLMGEYEGRLPLYHYDAWRADEERTFLEGGGAEHLDGEGVAVVEWADRVRAWLPRPRLEIRFEHLAPQERRLTLLLVPAGSSDPRAVERADGLRGAVCGLEAAHEPGDASQREKTRGSG